MTHAFFYGAVTKQQAEDILVIEYHFKIAVMPIAVIIKVERSHNDKTYEQLLQEALWYAEIHYTAMNESRGN